MPEVVGDQRLEVVEVVEVGTGCQGWKLVRLERGWRDVNSSEAGGGMMPQRENAPFYALGLPCSEGGGRRSNFESRQEVGCKARFKSGEKLRRLSTSLSRSEGGRRGDGLWWS